MAESISDKTRRGRAAIKSAFEHNPYALPYLRSVHVSTGAQLADMTEEERLVAIGQQSVVEMIEEILNQARS